MLKNPTHVFFTILISVILTTGCAKKPAPVQYKHSAFYTESKVIVQTNEKFFINDIKEGDVERNAKN